MFFVYDDNFLTEEEIKAFEDIYYDEGNKWTYFPLVQDGYIDHPGVIDTHVEDVPYFTHCPNENSAVYNAGKELALKFLTKHNIEFKDFTRVKFNITPWSPVEKTLYPHIDTHDPHYVFLYYVNDSDGDTFLYEQTASYEKLTEATVAKRITPKRGSAWVVDGAYYHSVSPPNRTNLRAIVNINLSR